MVWWLCWFWDIFNKLVFDKVVWILFFRFFVDIVIDFEEYDDDDNDDNDDDK